MSQSATPQPFIYLLNAMENAAQADNPAREGYGAKRQAVLSYVAKLEAAQSERATLPEGWVAVPREPTKEMLNKGWAYGGGLTQGQVAMVYGAMLAAAPSPSNEESK